MTDGYPIVMHTAVDALDVRALAEFYRQLLGVAYRPGDEGEHQDDWLVLVDANGHRVLAFNQVASLPRASWPSDDVPKQMHLDFRVPDKAELERHRARAEELGATVLMDRTAEEGEPLYVLADPEGHPFGLLVIRG